jgi:cytochrome c peroxidase
VQYRGRLVFRRTTDNGGRRIPPEKRCVTCHDGAYFTNRAKVRVFTTMWYDDPVGDEVDDLFDDDSFAALGIAYYYSADVRRALDVPHLNNIHDGTPYLHNGGAETLHELWARFNTFDWHGQTNDLTRRQLNDLIAYLEAL